MAFPRSSNTAKGNGGPRLQSVLPFIIGSAVVCAFVAALSIYGWKVSNDGVGRLAEERFDREVRAIQSLVQDYLDQHLNVLLSMRGLFLGSEYVNHFEWNSLVQGLEFRKRYPGISSVGYIERVSNDYRPVFEDLVRTDTSMIPVSLSEFKIYPEGIRDEYFVVKYFESLEESGEIIGLDLGVLLGEKLRAIRDSGELTSVGRIDLGKVVDDYTFILPFYSNGDTIDTPEDRQDAHIGFLVAGLRPSFFLERFSQIHEGYFENITIELLSEDGNILLRQSFPRELFGQEEDEERIIRSVPVSTAGLEWTLRVSGLRDFGLAQATMNMPELILLGGLGFSLLLFLILYLVFNSRQRALHLAQNMTSELGKFQLAVRQASNQIFITDAEGVILYANPATENTTGYSPVDVIGKTPRVWGEQMPKEYYEKMWRVIKEEQKPFDGEIFNKRRNGITYDALIHISPILDKRRNLYGFICIEEDITTRKRLERARSEFVSLASHQLRTPLTAMRLALETLISGAVGPVGQRQRDMLLRAFEYAVHMSETVSTMLIVSHLEAGKISVGNVPIKMRDFFNALLREYTPESMRRKLTVTCDCPDDLAVTNDPKLLKEILANLVSNAIKYTPEGGRVNIKARREDGYMTIDVSDTGYGIPADQHGRIFGKFFRASNIKKISTSGTGLGLYLVHSLTTLLGGRITFVSEENKGTTFSLFLPVTPSSNE